MNPINRLVSVDDVMELHPCYDRARVESLWGKRKRLRLSEIAGLDIPPEDRIWAIVRLVDRKTWVRFALACARRVLPLFERKRPGDKRPRECCDTVGLWLRRRATDEQARAAAANAFAAANDADAAFAAAARAAAPPEVRAALGNAAFAGSAAAYAADAATDQIAASSAASAGAAAAYAADATDARTQERDAQIRWWRKTLKEV